ncbi:MAG: fumarylacetoacetate hydrolase family protein [Dehalococcoidia bacterium]|jgi:2-keto-4-pentenoate hydratase/2-oxohepta-3-ene-1,7-dioic acid hydratase in catechol pathway
MRLLTFRREGVARTGIEAGGYVVETAKASELGVDGLSDAGDMLDLLRGGAPTLDAARQLLATVERAVGDGQADGLVARGVLHKLDEVELTAPVPAPSKIVAIGLNYRDHAREQGVPVPEKPLIFAKFPTSVIGPGDTITWDPALTQQVDYEAELAVVIGKKCRNVTEKDALSFVGGYTCGNDVSARDLQFGDRQWVRGKSLDTFCPLGPVLVTPDEVGDPQSLAIRTLLNGEVMQDSSTGEMVFGVAELIAFASRAFTLLAGDVLLTGTPSGVGVFRKPPVFLKDGDRIAIEIERIGRLENVCRTVSS